MIAHQTVMRREAVDALVTRPSGRFVDCTYGRGGHTDTILQQLAVEGRLMVLDQDLDAIEDARQKHGSDDRVAIIHGSFADVSRYIDANDMRPVDGILLDLGVSSPQLDQPLRGFSFSADGPLDMRMDQSRGQTAAEWLMATDEKEIALVISRYGEERFARRIARAIVSMRQDHAIRTTAQLVSIIEGAVPRWEKHKHPATRTFQAIRIYVNRELEALEYCLASTVDVLASGGRLVVISFHSLEDRIVKRFMRDEARGEKFPDRLPIMDKDITRRLKLVGKATKPGDEEVRSNRRARSAIMRVAEKT
jgi:16S rRNA (cytosine1402-N4)-methyltransferase